MTIDTTVNSDPLLGVRGLAVGVGSVRLLEGVSLDLAAGALVGVRGPSGCGKSMLLRTLAGLIDPLDGEVRFQGRNAGTEGWPAYRRQVVFVQQQPVTLRGSVRENLARPFAYRHVDTAFPEDRARDLLDRFRLGSGRFNEDARQLSVGEQQRVSLIRALLLEPAVYLLDEPTSALDPEATEAVEAVLAEEVCRRPCAALVVTHDTGQAERMNHGAIDVTPWLARPRHVGGTESRGPE